MSTSDPHATDTPSSTGGAASEGPTAPTEPVTAEPVTAEPGTTASSSGPEPAVSRTATEPPAAEPVEPEPAAPKPVAAEPTTPTAPAPAPSIDTGRHAVVRPAPEPPAPVTAPDPAVGRTAADPTVAAGAAAAERRDALRAAGDTGPAPDAPAASTAAVPPAPDGPDQPAPPTAPADPTLFPDPNAPRSTSVGAHVLGVVVGLVLAPIGIAITLLGQSRILAAQVDGWDGSTEVLGIVLVTLGLLLLAVVVLLGLWTPAVPLTGGGFLTLVGAVYLYAPALAREQTLHVLSSSGWRLTVTQVTVAGTSGTLVVAGFLLLVAGLVAGLARRSGVRLGAFRERHRL